MASPFYKDEWKRELREPFDGPMKLNSHADFVLYAKKWQEDNLQLGPILLDHFFRLVAALLFKGTARFCVDLVEFQTNSDQRKALMRMIRECPYLYVVRRHCSLPGKKRCTTWGLRNLNDLEQVRKDDPDVDPPVHTVSSPVMPLFRVLGASRCFYTIPVDRHIAFAQSWRAFCISRDYPVTYDYDGSTAYGAASFASLECTRLPERVDWSDFPGSTESLRWTRRLFLALSRGGFRRLCRRIYGRLYHPLVNLTKWLRRKLQMLYEGAWQAVAEVDLSCTYWVILASCLPDCAERRDLVDILSGADGRDFYTELNAACATPYASRDLVKPEVQKQCLFWKVWAHMDEKSRPLWFALRRRFPRLAAFINRMRSTMNGTYFSEFLTRRESAFFVDHMLPLVHGMGIPVLTIHDCLLVPSSVAQKVLSLCQREAEAFFGFVPKFGVV